MNLYNKTMLIVPKAFRPRLWPRHFYLEIKWFTCQRPMRPRTEFYITQKRTWKSQRPTDKKRPSTYGHTKCSRIWKTSKYSGWPITSHLWQYLTRCENGFEFLFALPVTQWMPLKCYANKAFSNKLSVARAWRKAFVMPQNLIVISILHSNRMTQSFLMIK